MLEERLKAKCDLYRLLLNPEEGSDSDECIEKALGLVTEIVGARLGYMEFTNSDGEKVWSTHHCDKSEVEAIQSNISHTIISEALATGDTIVTQSAFLDERFSNAHSVIQGKIESVLCSPITSGEFNGVIYLQGDLSGMCDRENIDEAEFFSQNIRPLLKRLKYRLSSVKPEDDLREMYKLEGVIGRSKSFLKVLNEAMTIAPLDVSLLMNGETGTGKSHIARVIHENSSRANRNFIHINCANIPEALFESELFGAAKGAYSGATGEVDGKVKAADGGTLFLDEISEMPFSAQAKLLQFLEEGFFFPLGSNTPVNPDVRVIVASNANFQEFIEQGKFREDLYYRIANFPLNIPPLRERKDDLDDLSVFFLKRLSQKFGYQQFDLSESCRVEIKKYDWPGNIREFQNKIQQGMIKAKISGSSTIEAEHLFADFSKGQSVEENEDITFTNEKVKWEKQFIAEQLNKHSWNVTRTAASLKMSRSHLNRLIKEYNLVKTD